MNASEYEALKAAIKVLFDHLTYEEQEQIIEIVKRKRTEISYGHRPDRKGWGGFLLIIFVF